MGVMLLGELLLLSTPLREPDLSWEPTYGNTTRISTAGCPTLLWQAVSVQDG